MENVQIGYLSGINLLPRLTVPIFRLLQNSLILKEFVEPKVRADIDGLPLTIEGYERAKNILKGEYGKTSEIVKAYVQNILDLPVVKGSDPSEVNNFYKILLFNVQSLETLGKIERVNGMTRSVLDKLSGIKSDLVKGQGNYT